MTQETYGEVYQTGFRLTFRLLRSRGVPWDRASEVTQAAWTKGLERLAQLENDSMVVTWVNAIALNAWARLQSREPVWEDLTEVSTASSGINTAAIDMARILRICCPGDRALLRYQMNGLTPGEIARMRGVPESAIRIRLMRARRAARQRIEQVGRKVGVQKGRAA
jgi:DNA-directed RNA polymerase specialized sigma24 family protein